MIGPSLPPLDPRTDPRLRYSFADVAMKIAHDGPWYFVLAVVLVLALRGTTTALESMVGLAMAMLGRSRPPEAPDKGHLIRSVAGALLVLLAVGGVHVACGPSAVATLNPQPLPPRAIAAAVVR